MEPTKPITLSRSVLIGTAGFTIASLVVYGFWAGAGRVMYRTLGEAGFYAVCAVLFMVLGVVLLKPLTRLSYRRFAAVFAGAFFAYALCWCLGWFLVRGRTGEWVGSFAGSLAFCLVLAGTFRAWGSLVLITLVLFVVHSAGYFLGGYAYAFLRSESPLLAKLGWGLFYGLGTGVGLGFAFYKAQRPKAELTPQTS